MSSSTALRIDPSEDEESRAQTATLVTDLQERLEQADLAVQEVKRQNEALQARFDDSTKDQAEMEEKLHEEEERREELENEKRELVKQKRELENIYEAERAAVMKDRDATNSREEELQNVIQRLKESLAQKDYSRSTSLDPDSSSRNGKKPALNLLLVRGLIEF
jgi:chromosome segregation ATPase